jgi:hypothetical protein
MSFRERENGWYSTRKGYIRTQYLIVFSYDIQVWENMFRGKKILLSLTYN